jgi:CubicO group peptidase (beta-lactamase class C family)
VNLAEGWVAQDITPALVILVARRGVIVIHEAFGRLTPEPDSPPLKLDTIYPIASISKPITATGVMILVEDGLLGLNRPVSWYIPEFVGEGKDAVMVHHLLTHTSGLRDEDLDAHAEKKKGTVEIPPPDETQHPQINENLFLRYDAPLWKPPGTEMSYCGYGYVLMGEIIRRVSGKSLDDFARERIFEPLGMKDTFYIVPDSVQHRVVKRPADAPFTWYDTREGQEMPHAAGGVYSTAVDMAIFGQMFLNRGTYGDARILSPASVTEMTRNQVPGIGARFRDEFFPEASWGFGWNVHGSKKSQYRGTLHSPEAFCHGGSGGVFSWVDPVYEIVGVYLSVMLSEDADYREFFMNAVTAAVVDV